MARLEPFLKTPPGKFRFAVEIRNQEWVDGNLLDLLRHYKIGLVLTDQSRMLRPWEYSSDLDFLTADFAYVRLLGDRQSIEAQTQVWNRVIVDRQEEFWQWAREVEAILRRIRHVFLYANNHYQGYSPGTAEKVLKRVCLRGILRREPDCCDATYLS